MPKLKSHSGAKKRFNLTKTGKVKVLLVGDLKRPRGGHDAELLAGGPDQPDLTVADLLVELMHIAANTEAPPKNGFSQRKRKRARDRTRKTNAGLPASGPPTPD